MNQNHSRATASRSASAPWPFSTNHRADARRLSWSRSSLWSQATWSGPWSSPAAVSANTQKEPGVALPGRLRLPALDQPLGRVLPDRLEEPESRAPAVLGLPQQALVGQRLQAVEDRLRSGRACLRGRPPRRPRARSLPWNTDRPASSRLSLGAEQPVAPVEGAAQGLLSRGRSRAPRLRSASGLASLSTRSCSDSALRCGAASSMASGSPSRRRQASATSLAFPAFRTKSGLASIVRSTKRRTAGTRLISSGSPPWPDRAGRAARQGSPSRP